MKSMTVMKKGTTTKMKYQQGQTRLSSQYAKRGVSKFTLKTYVSIWGTFHLSELTGQKIPVENDNFTFNQNYPVKSQMACTKEMGFQQKLLEKCVYHCQNDWSGRSVLTLGKRPKEA